MKFWVACLFALIVAQGSMNSAYAASVCAEHPKLRYPLILGYHDIVGDDGIQNSSDLALSDFKKQIEALKKAGFRFASLEHFHKEAAKGRSLRENTIILSFDDGYAGQYDAYKYLDHAKIPADFFVISGTIGVTTAREHLDSTQLKEMHRNGYGIQSHTLSHPNLKKIAADSARVEHELIQGKKNLDELLHSKPSQPHFLAYPEGGYTASVAAIARQNYDMAFGYSSEPVRSVFSPTPPPFDPKIDPCYQIPRFPVGQGTKNIETLLDKLKTFRIQLGAFEREAARFQEPVKIPTADTQGHSED